LKNLLLTALAGKDTGRLSRTGIPEGSLAIHIMYTGFKSQSGVLAILVRVGPVVAVAAMNRDVYATNGIHDADQSIEIGASEIVYPDAQVIE
jgi:hypothetical protein